MQEEMCRKWLESLPMVTDEEQEDINRHYGKPDRTKNIFRGQNRSPRQGL
jgi:hypothetical protein